MADDFEKHTWDVIDCYFSNNKGYQLVKHQIESYNDFILRRLDQIIAGFNPIEIHYQYNGTKFKYIMVVEVHNPVINKPVIVEKDGSTKTMTPNDARQRNFTYSSNLTVDLKVVCKTLGDDDEYQDDIKELKNVLLGKIPIMVKSNYCILSNKFALVSGHECQYDYGGYFIINGNEKVIISQDRISENKTYVFINNKVSTYSHVAEIRSVQENKLGVPKITSLKLSAKGNQFGRYIRANIHHIKNDIPVFILFKALGLNNDKEIYEYILYDLEEPLHMALANELIGSTEEANNITCPKDALEYLSRYLNITGYPKEVLNNKIERIEIVRNVLRTEFLPHVGKEFHKKALYLGYMVNKLIKCFLGLKDFDDRDSYINKKIDTPGVLMGNLLRQYYSKVVKDMKNMIQKEINVGGWKVTNKFSNIVNKVNIYKIIKSTIIDSGMRYALSTGNWGIKNNKNKQGVAQVLNRMTYSATLSHMRRINTPIEKSGKLVQPRKLHSTQWGIICPAETPEGSSVGLVKNMSMCCSITISSNSTNVREVAYQEGVRIFDGADVTMFAKKTKVIINGDIIGIHDDPAVFHKKMREYKMSGKINIYTSIVWNIKDREILICTEGGRCVRPLYVINQDTTLPYLTPEIVERIKLGSIHWKDLLINCHVIEFLDVEEVNTSMIAMKYQDLLKGTKGSLLPVKYTHLEMHPSLILGVLASTIPFSDHNQSPRNCTSAEDHEVLTEHGFLKLNEILNYTENGKQLGIACYVNGTLEFHKISRDGVVYQDDDGNPLTATEFVSFESKTVNCERNIPGKASVPASATKKISLLMTTNHNMYGRIGFANRLGLNSYRWPQKMMPDRYRSVPPDYTKITAGDIIKFAEKDPNPPTKGAPRVPVFQFQCNFENGVKPTTDNLPFIEALGLKSEDEIDAFLWLYGYWLGDGWLEGRIANISFGPVKKQDIEKLTEIFNRLPLPLLENRDFGAHGYWKAKDYDSVGTWRFAICSKTWWNYFAEQYGHKYQGKYAEEAVKNGAARRNSGLPRSRLQIKEDVYTQSVPTRSTSPQPPDAEDINSAKWFMPWVYTSLDASKLKIMISGLRFADGNQAAGSTQGGTIHTSSERFRDEIERVCIMAGYTVSTRYGTGIPGKICGINALGHEIIAKNQAWTVDYTTASVSANPYLEIGNEIKLVKMDKPVRVFCVTVPTKSHLIMFRRRQEGQLASRPTIIGNCYQSAQAKQAIGVYTSNFRERYDTLAHVLQYPQKPIVKTRIGSILNTDKMPNGINAIVVIATYTGYNLEDSLMINQSSVDRGLFVSTYYRTYKEQNNKNHSNGEEEFFTRPEVKSQRPFNYDKLERDGFVKENTYIEGGDIIIGKCMPNKVGNIINNKDNSVVFKTNDNGFIDRNVYNDNYFTTVNGDGYNFAKVRIRSDRIPTIGDKLSSRSGQHRPW